MLSEPPQLYMGLSHMRQQLRGSTVRKSGRQSTTTLHEGGRRHPSDGVGGLSEAGDAAISVRDTRAGDLTWTTSASTTDFDRGANLINGQNFGFTAVVPGYLAGNALNAGTKPVGTNDVPAIAGPPVAPAAAGVAGLKDGPHSFATAARGVGTVNISGVLNLLAPTSTLARVYTATLTVTAA